MSQMYEEVDQETLELFNQVKSDYFPEITDDVTFKVLFRLKKKGSDNSLVFAEMTKFSSLVRKLTSEIPEYSEDGLDYCLSIDKNCWNLLNDEEKRLLLFHEINHVHVEWKEDGTKVCNLRDHDIKEFRSVIKMAQEMNMPDWDLRVYQLAKDFYDQQKEQEKENRKKNKKKK